MAEPTENQKAQAEYQNFLLRRQQAAADMPPLVAGQPVGSREEAEQAAGIAFPQVPATSQVIRDMATPENLITTGAEIGAGIMTGGNPAAITAAGRAAQIPATVAGRMSRGEPVLDTGTVADLGYNLAVNEFGNKVLGPVIGKGIGLVGQSVPVQAFRSAIAKRVIGKVTQDAAAGYAFSREMIDDVTNAVNDLRQRNGKPLYTRDEVERRIAPHLENLAKRGAFTIPDLTTGGLVDSIEPLAEGAIAGKGTFASKRADQDALLNEWPKVWAAMLGEEANGPDEMAAIAATSIEWALRGREVRAGQLMEAAESVVGDRVVKITPALLDGMQREIQAYTKRYMPADGTGPVKIDPEGLDQNIQNAINLVARATGQDFDYATGTFVQRIPKGLAGQPPSVIAAMQAQGVLPAPQTVDFTFTDIKTIRSGLGRMAEKARSKDFRREDAALTSLSEALRGSLNEVLDAEDKLTGKVGAPDSMRNLWQRGSDEYAAAERLRQGFDSRGWIETLNQRGAGAKLIPQIWPDNADINRITALKDLMGGEASPYWQQLRRFKAESLVDAHTKSPESLLNHLTDSKQHSLGYWHEALGKDQYDRLLKFAKLLNESGKRNPFQGEAGLSRRADAGFIMRFANPSAPTQAANLATAGGAAALLGAGAGAALTGASIGGIMFSTRKVAQWLTNPEDSAMFMHVISGKPITMKARQWLRNNVARAIADASMTDQPDVIPIPLSDTRQGIKDRNAAALGMRG